jgi:hypothetical protein
MARNTTAGTGSRYWQQVGWMHLLLSQTLLKRSTIALNHHQSASTKGAAQPAVRLYLQCRHLPTVGGVRGSQPALTVGHQTPHSSGILSQHQASQRFLKMKLQGEQTSSHHAASFSF